MITGGRHAARRPRAGRRPVSVTLASAAHRPGRPCRGRRATIPATGARDPGPRRPACGTSAVFGTAEPAWMIDGNYTSVVGQILRDRAGLVITLDLPRWRVMARITRRTLGGMITRAELWSGNREEWRNLLTLEPETKQCASAAGPRGHRGGLVSKVAVPGRTAHEGKPASHDTSVPSPPHPPEGAGTLGQYPGGLDQRHPPHPRRRPEAFAFLADAVDDRHWPSGVKEIRRQAELAGIDAQHRC